MSKSRALQLLGGIVLAGAGLSIFFRDLEPGALVEQIMEIRFRVILWIIFLSIATLWLRALRWKILLPSSKQGHKKGLFPVVTIAFMVNNIMPARIGEAVRVMLLWKRNGYTLTTSIGSLLLERTLDSLVFLSFFFIPVFLSSQLSILSTYAYITAGFFTIALLFFVIYSFFPTRIYNICMRIIGFFPKRFRSFMEKTLEELIENLDWIFSFKKVIAVGALSFSVAFCYVLVLYALSGKIENFTIIDSMFGQAFAAFGSAIPLAPGYVGTLHASLQYGLTLAGVPAGSTGAIVILYHALPFLIVTFAGLFLLAGTNITFKDISHAREQIKESQTETEKL
ncbi:hypothetical protein CHISP_1797 [Chitinispirillum alkaliphilum]|nr:hypothetical protein CHISP_1797 [Chitinispirillum alkaliphilum]